MGTDIHRSLGLTGTNTATPKKCPFSCHFGTFPGPLRSLETIDVLVRQVGNLIPRPFFGTLTPFKTIDSLATFSDSSIFLYNTGPR